MGNKHHDAMHAWHCLEPALPMGLKYVATIYCPDMEPWALLSTKEPEFYSAADSDILLCCYNGIRHRLEEQGRWAMFARHFTALHGVLLAMTRRGVGADAPRMKVEQDKFIAAFHAEVAAVQPLIPLDILPRKVYKKRDANKKPGNWVIIQEEVELKSNEVVEDGWIKKLKKEKPPKKVRIRKDGSVSIRGRPSKKGLGSVSIVEFEKQQKTFQEIEESFIVTDHSAKIATASKEKPNTGPILKSTLASPEIGKSETRTGQKQDNGPGD